MQRHLQKADLRSLEFLQVGVRSHMMFTYMSNNRSVELASSSRLGSVAPGFTLHMDWSAAAGFTRQSRQQLVLQSPSGGPPLLLGAHGWPEALRKR